MNEITVFLLAMTLGSMLTDIRYYFLMKKNRHKITSKPRHYKHTHSRGETTNGDVYVYCPVGNIFSWSHGDYTNKWCHFCKLFFSEKVNNLLDPDEQHLRAI